MHNTPHCLLSTIIHSGQLLNLHDAKKAPSFIAYSPLRITCSIIASTGSLDKKENIVSCSSRMIVEIHRHRKSTQRGTTVADSRIRSMPVHRHAPGTFGPRPSSSSMSRHEGARRPHNTLDNNASLLRW